MAVNECVDTVMDALKKKSRIIYRRLRKQHPSARIELNYNNPIDLLVATILSAQCTDKKVNDVTNQLFKKYKTAQDYVSAPVTQLASDIRATGFFNQKAKSIQGALNIIIDQYNGNVPQKMEQLVKLPGIGRKTANVILGNGFGIPGIAVDTHVIRLCERIGLSNEKTPERIEQDLMKLISRQYWTHFTHTIIFHGRYICKARKPLCPECSIKDLCNYYASVVAKSSFLPRTHVLR